MLHKINDGKNIQPHLNFRRREPEKVWNELNEENLMRWIER